MYRSENSAGKSDDLEYVSSVDTEQLKNTCNNEMLKINSSGYSIIISGKIDMLMCEDGSQVKEADVVVRTATITPRQIRK